MIIDYENNTNNDFTEFDLKSLASEVINAVLKHQEFNYDVLVSVYLVDNNEIQTINSETRGIDKPTDVLSFPNIEFESIKDYSVLDDYKNNYDIYDPELDIIILGEIILSYDKIVSQAKEYGHSEKREAAFLIAHSMLHLLGYDHIDDDERLVMENVQNEVLDILKIYRD